jgi:hypothetical protein
VARPVAVPAAPRPATVARWRLLEGVALVVLLLLALYPRFYDLEGHRSAFPDLFDEGIRSEQLMLMAHGFRPFRDIYTSQGLLLLDLLFPFYQAFGGTLGAARMGVGLLSLLGILGVWWSTRQVSGPVGGLAAAALLVSSLPFVEGSMLALAEVPSLVPCTWAIGCAVRYQREGGRARDGSARGRDVAGRFRIGQAGWLYAAVLLATLGILIKPMAIAIVVPIALLALLRPGLRWQHLVIAVLLALGLTALLVVVLGPREVYDQIVAYRAGAREAAIWQPRRNFKLVVLEPIHNQPGLYVLALISAALLLGRNWRRGLALISWPVAAMALLVVYYPIHPKHLVYLVPPLAVLGGAGLGLGARLAWREAPTGRGARLLTVGVALFLAMLPIGVLPDPFNNVPPASAGNDNDDSDLHVFDQATVQSIDLLTDPGAFILTDHPFLAAAANRLVPPNLVDPSRGRTRAGVLTDRDAIDAASQFDTRLVLIWADRLRRLPGVPPWLDRNYQVVHAFGTRDLKNARGAKDRAIYLRRDSDFNAARARLASALEVQETADLGGKLRLLGTSVEPPAIGRKEQFTVTVGWEALARISADYNVSLNLVSPDGGDYRAEQENDLEGTVKPTPTWETGRWFFHTFALQPEDDTPVGTYLIQIAVNDPKLGKALQPVVAASNAVVQPHQNGLLTIGTIEIH